MKFIQLLVTLGILIGLFSVFALSPAQFTALLRTQLMHKRGGIKGALRANQKPKDFIRRTLYEVEAILIRTGRQGTFSHITLLALTLFLAGGLIALFMGNLFLVPVLSVGLMFLPFWYVMLSEHHYKKVASEELETSLSMITTSYLRCEDITLAIEENLNYIQPPIKDVFSAFVYRQKMVHPDIILNLRKMKAGINHSVFQAWCDSLIQCQMDRNLKSTLLPTLSKLSDMRLVNGELETLIFGPRKEFITMQMLVLFNIPLLYFLNKSWFDTLMHTWFGQLVLAFCFLVMFVATAWVIRLTKPIEYKR